ncbi:MAG: energy transducer TonB [Planctomycetia bacterium]|nr:energy transducer TonB [Candidatus Brocadia sp.]QOJ06378.1 MAG: energy transducer TonB [Planctomycetia bacterium]TVL95166.1 MAG: hypothetical protein CV082_12010 [Candidatus Brocadia sp. BL1]HQU31874.1 energy transducer TonB [Candidatus Brocadia sapporoensis]
MTFYRFGYYQVKPGNHGVIKGFILALFIHGILFFTGGKLLVKSVQYSVESTNGAIDVDLVAALSQSDTEAVESVVPITEQHQELVKQQQPEADMVKPSKPVMENQQETVKTTPKEEPATSPQPNMETKEFITPVVEKQQEAIKPLQPDIKASKPGAATTEKKQEAPVITQSSSQGTTITKIKPDYLRNQPPEYPQLAKQMRQEGLVILKVEVDQKGVPITVEVEQGSGYQLLDQAALKAVKRWRFQPERIGGMPVKSRVSIPVRFRLEESDKKSHMIN